MSTTNIYVLRLEGGRYYVGKSIDVQKRYQEHLDGKGAVWTKRYRPIALEKTIPNASVFEEDKITKEYMAKYGIDKVRGGSYVETELSQFHLDALNMEIWAAKDLCTRCGRSGHFVRECYAKTDASGNQIEEEEEESEEEWECDFCDRTFTTEYGCGMHERSCSAAKQQGGRVVGASTCYRCGRQGHYAEICYARTHRDGDELDSDSEDDSD
jgi:predicted GIY-YIG superfamily endonuclease